MTSSEIPEPIRRFVLQNLDSIEELEILLLLRQQSTRSWTAQAVGFELAIDAAAAAHALERLCSRNLLDVRIAQDLLYRFAPGATGLAEGVTELAEAYPRHRLAIIALLASKPLERIRDFADAFRLKQDKDKLKQDDKDKLK